MAAAAASFLKPLPALFSLLLISFSPSTLALPSCNGPCSDLNDLNDDCKPTESMSCDGRYPTYTCSPPIYSSTTAILTLNNFTEGGDGGGPSKCTGKYYDNSEPVVALSTGWYADGQRCLQMIRITAQNGKSTTAMVVDECDSMRGCDEEHAFQRPCRNNIVDGSKAVWDALELDTNDPDDKGEPYVTWFMA